MSDLHCLGVTGFSEHPDGSPSCGSEAPPALAGLSALGDLEAVVADFGYERRGDALQAEAAVERRVVKEIPRRGVTRRASWPSRPGPGGGRAARGGCKCLLSALR